MVPNCHKRLPSQPPVVLGWAYDRAEVLSCWYQRAQSLYLDGIRDLWTFFLHSPSFLGWLHRPAANENKKRQTFMVRVWLVTAGNTLTLA